MVQFYELILSSTWNYVGSLFFTCCVIIVFGVSIGFALEKLSPYSDDSDDIKETSDKPKAELKSLK